MSIEERRKQRVEESKKKNKNSLKNLLYISFGIIALPFLWSGYNSYTMSPCYCYEKSLKSLTDGKTNEFLDDCADTYKYRYAIYDYQTIYFGKSTRGYIEPSVARDYFYDLCEQSK